MITISIKQPMAELIAMGIKRIENRAYAPSYRGVLAIHAGKKISRTDNAAAIDWVRDNYSLTFPETLSYGAVIAVVDFVAVLRPDKTGKTAGLFGPGEKSLVQFPIDMAFWDHSSIGWVFQNAKRIRPIPMAGKLGLFEAEIESKIEYI